MANTCLETKGVPSDRDAWPGNHRRGKPKCRECPRAQWRIEKEGSRLVRPDSLPAKATDDRLANYSTGDSLLVAARSCGSLRGSSGWFVSLLLEVVKKIFARFQQKISTVPASKIATWQLHISEPFSAVELSSPVDAAGQVASRRRNFSRTRRSAGATRVARGRGVIYITNKILNL